MRAFKNLVAVSFESDYSFKQADAVKSAAANAPAASSSSAPAATGEAKKEEEPEEEEEVDMGDLFGGGDDY